MRANEISINPVAARPSARWTYTDATGAVLATHNGSAVQGLAGAGFPAALKSVSARDKIALPKDVAIDGSVGIGQIPNCFGIEVELKISMPGMDRAKAQERPVRRP